MNAKRIGQEQFEAFTRECSLNFTKFSASELYPVAMSFLFDWSNLVRFSVLS